MEPNDCEDKLSKRTKRGADVANLDDSNPRSSQEERSEFRQLGTTAPTLSQDNVNNLLARLHSINTAIRHHQLHMQNQTTAGTATDRQISSSSVHHDANPSSELLNMLASFVGAQQQAQQLGQHEQQVVPSILLNETATGNAEGSNAINSGRPTNNPTSEWARILASFAMTQQQVQQLRQPEEPRLSNGQQHIQNQPTTRRTDRYHTSDNDQLQVNSNRELSQMLASFAATQQPAQQKRPTERQLAIPQQQGQNYTPTESAEAYNSGHLEANPNRALCQILTSLAAAQHQAQQPRLLEPQLPIDLVTLLQQRLLPLNRHHSYGSQQPRQSMLEHTPNDSWHVPPPQPTPQGGVAVPVEGQQLPVLSPSAQSLLRILLQDAGATVANLTAPTDPNTQGHPLFTAHPVAPSNAHMHTMPILPVEATTTNDFSTPPNQILRELLGLTQRSLNRSAPAAPHDILNWQLDQAPREQQSLQPSPHIDDVLNRLGQALRQQQSQAVSTTSSNRPNLNAGDSSAVNSSLLTTATNSTMSDEQVAKEGSLLLSLPSDHNHLSEYQICVRRQLEFFVAQQEDVALNIQGRKKQICLYQVGIRCIHCALVPLGSRTKGAVYYPARLTGVYQAAQNMATSHLMESCLYIGEDTKQLLRTLRDRRDMATGGKLYWAETCISIGMFETETGLRLKKSTACAQ